MSVRLRVLTAAATAVIGLAALAPAAGAHGWGHRHHHRLTSAQVQCLADHGFAIGAGAPKPDLRDPAVRAALFTALRECGVVGRHAPPPTSTTTSTSSPVIVSVRANR